MREYIADRLEDGVLVCFDADGDRLALPCPRLVRPEGRRVLVFGAIGAATPYVFVSGAVAAPDGASALIFAPDEKRRAATKARFGEIFKKST